MYRVILLPLRSSRFVGSVLFRTEAVKGVVRVAVDFVKIFVKGLLELLPIFVLVLCRGIKVAY